MKLLKWIPLFCSMLLYGQIQTSYDSSVVVLIDSILVDSLWFEQYHNSFSEEDEILLLGYDPLEQSILSNQGSPLLNYLWKPQFSTKLRIGDRLLDSYSAAQEFSFDTSTDKPFTKIFYLQGYNEGQRLRFWHSRAYRYGAMSIDYDRLVSQGYLWHEKNKQTRFAFNGNFKHPNFPYQSKLQIATFKNESEWNGGVSDDSLFVSGSQSNWELLPVNWSNLKTSIKHKGLDWKHSYSFSEKSELEYELALSQDSLFYEGLEDDTLFYPLRLDSVNEFIRVFTNTNHSLKWTQQINDDKNTVLGVKHQQFSQRDLIENQLLIFSSLHSSYFKNDINFSYGMNSRTTNSLIANYTQRIDLLGMRNTIKLGYEKTMPNWMKQNNVYSSGAPQFVCVQEDDRTNIDQYIEWDLHLGKNFSLHHSYHNIDGYMYFNEGAISVLSEETVQVFQSRLKHHLSLGKWHWKGDIAYQNSSSDNLPLANLFLNQKVYWQGAIFKEASLAQIGLRALYRSSHVGLGYSPIIGDFYLNPMNATKAMTRLDFFANFQVKSLKLFCSYDHLNAHWQGTQYSIKPYPLAKPTFRIGLIWNFFD